MKKSEKLCQICGNPKGYRGAYEMCRECYMKCIDPRWQLAFPYRDEKKRLMEFNRTYENCEAYRGAKFFALLWVIRDFGLEKDGLRMILDHAQIDKDRVRLLQKELRIILRLTQSLFHRRCSP